MTEETVPSWTIHGREFHLAVLTLGAMKKIGPALKVAKSLSVSDEILSEEQIDALVTIVHASAKLAEPTLTREEFAEIVEGGRWDDASAELLKAFTLVMLGSGFTKTTKQDGDAGKAPSPESSTSLPSTDSLSPAPGGDSPTLTG